VCCRSPTTERRINVPNRARTVRSERNAPVGAVNRVRKRLFPPRAPQWSPLLWCMELPRFCGLVVPGPTEHFQYPPVSRELERRAG